MPTVLRKPDATIGPFREGNTVILTATIIDNLGVAIPGSSLTTATFTLFSEVDPFDIINSRNHVDIKSSIDSNGLLTMTLTAADMAIVEDHDEDDDVEETREYHRALIEWTYPGSRQGSFEIRIVVSDLVKVS